MEYVIAVELLPVHIKNWINKLDKQRSKWIHNPIGVDFSRLHINKLKRTQATFWCSAGETMITSLIRFYYYLVINVKHHYDFDDQFTIKISPST